MRVSGFTDQLISRKQLKIRPVMKTADGERDQEKKNKKTKRARHEYDDDRILDTLPSFKKIHVDYSQPDDDLTLVASSSSHDSNNSPTEAGVFDFPWLKETMTIKSDWKLDDAFAFASSLDATTNISEILQPHDLLIVTGKCGSQALAPTASVHGSSSVMISKNEDGEEDSDGGLDSVWDSLLDQQPLSIIEFEVGGF